MSLLMIGKGLSENGKVIVLLLLLRLVLKIELHFKYK